MFRKLLFTLLLASVFAISAKAQKTVTLHFNPLDTTADVGSTVNLKVEQTGMSTIAAIQLKIEWDPAVVSFVDPIFNVDPELSGFFSNLTASSYTLVWIDSSDPAVDHSFGDLLFEMPFLVEAVGSSDIFYTQSTMGEQDGNVTYTVITDTATITGVNPGTPDPLVLQVGSTSVDMNDDGCVDVTVTSGFTDITRLDFSLGWNSTIGQYLPVTDLNTTLGLTAANFNTSQTGSGQLGFTYTGAGSALSAGDVLFKACYTGIGAEGSSTAISFGDAPTTTVVENSDGALAKTLNNGSLSINTSGGGGVDTFLHLMIPDTVSSVGANICVPITVRNFNVMSAATFSLSWDPNILKLDTAIRVEDPNSPPGLLGGLNTQDTAVGKLGYAYVEFTADEYTTLPDYTTILDVCFDVVGEIGDESPLLFGGSPISIYAQDSAHLEINADMSVDTSSGSLEIPAVIFETFHLFGDQSDCTQGVLPGDTIAIDILVDNLIDMTSFQVQFPVDETKLTFLSALTEEFIPHDFFNLVNFSGGNLTLIWTSENADPYTWSPDSTKIVTLYFEAKTSSAAGDVVDFVFDDSFTSAGGPNGDVPAEAHDILLHITAPLALNATVTDLSCDVTNDGAIVLNPTGWTGGYTYNWSGPGGPYSGASIADLTAGTYDVTVTSCNQTVTESFLLEEHTGFAVSVVNLINEAFPPGNNGSATVTGSGAGPYTYSWTGPGGPYSGATITNLAEGTYIAFVDDGNGCVSSLGVGVDRLTVVGAFVNPTCNGANNGSISVTASGSPGTYTYEWSDGLLSGANPTGLAAGDYTVTVSDATTAEVVLSYTLVEPSAINIQFDGTLSTPSGMNNGAVNVTVSGGTPTYTYAWTGGGINEDLTGVGVGSYSLTVTDGNGCSKIGGPYTVSSFGTPNPTVVLDSVDCNGQSNGSITISSITSGTAPYTISGIGGDQTTDGNSPVVYTGLAVGDYTLTIVDANTEDTTITLHIYQPAVLAIVDQNVTPSSGNNGIISFNMQGGTAPFQYDWDHDSYDGVEDIFGLQAEDYSVTVTDAHGCSVSQTFTVASASVPVPLVDVTDVACNGGNSGVITITSIAGANPNYTITGINPTQTTDGATAVTYSGLAAGSYGLTVTDNIGTDTAFVVVVGQPLPITFSNIVKTNEVAPPGNNGSISLDVSGGTPNASAPFYGYQWTGGYNTEDIAGLAAGSYKLTVVDGAGCVGISDPIVITQEMASFSCSTTVTNTDCPMSENGKVILTVLGGQPVLNFKWFRDGQQVALSKNLNDIGAGFYTVTVTDANGVTTSCSASVSQESFLIGSIEVQSDYNGYNVSGFGKTDGQAMANPENGAFPYSYTWSSGVHSQTANMLSGGQVIVTITDNLGCEVIVTENLTEPDVLACSTSVTPTPCKGSSDGAIDLTVSGGVTTYSYSWAGPDSFMSGAQNLSSLKEGAYLVTITDANGNQTACNGTILAASDMSLAFDNFSNYNNYNISCTTCSDGSVMVTATGGQAPYTYIWGNGDTRQQPDTLRAGVVGVTVTDDLGCTKEGTVTMTAPGVFTCSVVTTNTVCPGSSEGTAVVVLSGGVTPIASYFWTGPGGPFADSLLTGLAQGTYDVTVTDANGSTTTCSNSVEQLSQLAISVNVTAQPSSSTVADGKAKVIAVNGSEPYTYAWSNGETTETATSLPSGPNSVSVTDNLGCVRDLSFVLVPINDFIPTIVTKSASCYGVCDGEASITIEGGLEPFSYAWSTGQAGSSVSGMCAGAFTVTITDNSNQVKVITDTIRQPDSLAISFVITNPTAFNAADGSAIATVTGGTPDYEYLWNDGDPATIIAEITGTRVDEYLLIVRDANNCTEMGRVRFTAPPTDDCYAASKVLTPGVLDGSNDQFAITCLDPLGRNDLTIYSQWGQLVYSHKNYDGSWTGIDDGGKDLPEGAYYWVLSYTENGEEATKKGHVTIIR